MLPENGAGAALQGDCVVEQRLSVVTLGVDDVERTRGFFEKGLGWKASALGDQDIAVFDTGGCVLALFCRKALADDAAVRDDGASFPAVSIAWNGASKAEVDAAYEKAVAAGAEPVKPPVAAYWGGYSGYVRIPGGHLLEIAYNPVWPLDAAGRPQLPPPLGATPEGC